MANIASGIKKATSAIGNAVKAQASSSGSSSGGTSSGSKTVQANAQGNAPSGTNVGDLVNTKGGTYKVVSEGTPGASYNPDSKLWSVKVGSGSDGFSGGSTETTKESWSDNFSKLLNSLGSSQGEAATYLDDNGNKQQGLYTSDPLRYDKIQQMQALANAWKQTDDQDQRDKLADQSYILGASIGATRDKDGVWWYDGQKLFDTQYEPEEVPNYYENYQQQLADYQAQQQDLIQQQYEAALEAAKLSLDSQKTQVNQQYDDLARQLYIERRMSEKNLPQQMAAMGYTGGITESSTLGLQTSYAEALRQGETQRINTIASLEQAIRQAELEGNRELAAQLASLAQNTMGLYADALAQIQNQANVNYSNKYQAIQNAIANNQWNQQYIYNQEQDKLDRETAQKQFEQQQQAQQQSELNNMALQLMQYGIVPDTATLMKMGYTQQQAQQLAQRMWLIQQGYYG